MKYYGIMYHLRDGAYVEGCGDRSVVVLDGRYNLFRQMGEANEWARRYGFDGYRVARGSSLLNLFYLNAAVVPVAAPILAKD